MVFREQKTEELIRHLAADFLQRESNRVSLITVTNVTMLDKLTKAMIYISVLPTDAEEDALDFVKRKRSEFREYLREHTKLQKLPFVDFAIDLGEKNRQRIDELSNNL
jgi:ribosome-binding factor A